MLLRHIYIIVLFISATSCKGGKDIVCITDTVYISKRQYDSVFIDRQSTTSTIGDTVFVNRMQTEYRYKLKTDTLHLHHTDTIVHTIGNKTPPENNHTAIWITATLTALALGWMAFRKRK